MKYELERRRRRQCQLEYSTHNHFIIILRPHPVASTLATIRSDRPVDEAGAIDLMRLRIAATAWVGHAVATHLRLHRSVNAPHASSSKGHHMFHTTKIHICTNDLPAVDTSMHAASFRHATNCTDRQMASTRHFAGLSSRAVVHVRHGRAQHGHMRPLQNQAKK